MRIQADREVERARPGVREDFETECVVRSLSEDAWILTVVK
jgi:hypothetical protein